MGQPFLSIIIPAYNEESRLPSALGRLFEFLGQQAYSAEVLVVENGSTDRTMQVGQELASDHANLHIMHIPQRGKGLAIQAGMSAANGQFRFIADADFSMPVEQINLFLPPVCDCDIAIASREAKGAVRINEPGFRHFTGRVFNSLIRLLVLPGLEDTQCGFKCFRADAAQDIFHYQTLGGWAFDVEVLHVARLHGWRIREVPIRWQYFPGSKVSVFRDSIRMFLDLLTIRRNTRQGLYARKN